MLDNVKIRNKYIASLEAEIQRLEQAIDTRNLRIRELEKQAGETNDELINRCCNLWQKNIRLSTELQEHIQKIAKLEADAEQRAFAIADHKIYENLRFFVGMTLDEFALWQYKQKGGIP